MDATRFDALFDEELVAPLVELGFTREGHHLYYDSEEGTLGLLRFQGKFDGLRQATNFVLGIRHRFLRDTLNEVVVSSHLKAINDYPFKERPAKLNARRVASWAYRRKNLGVRSTDYDTIEYGGMQDDSSARRELVRILAGVANGGLPLLARLRPVEALRQLMEHGEDAWCERMWIEDYERFNSGLQTPAPLPNR